MQLEKEKTRTGNGNTSLAERLAELAKTNFKIDSFKLTLSYLGTQTVSKFIQ